MQNIDMSSCHLIYNANVYLTIPEKKKKVSTTPKTRVSFYSAKDHIITLT